MSFLKFADLSDPLPDDPLLGYPSPPCAQVTGPKTFTPLPQQSLMIGHMLDHPIAAVFAEPGLGKTGATLAVIGELICNGDIRAALIVAPKNVVTMTWPAEVEKWKEFNWLRMVSLRNEAGWDAWNSGSADVFLVNFDLLQQFVERGIKGKKHIPVDMLVVDELSKFKDPSSKRAAALRLNARFKDNTSMFKRRVGLTGTPAANSYMGLFAQMRMLDGGKRLGTGITEYRQRYFDQGWNGFSWKIKDWAPAVIEEKISDITLALRRKDYLHIPPTTFEDIEIEMPAALRKAYRVLEKELLLMLKDTEIVAMNAAVLVGKLLQMTSGSIYDGERKVTVIHDLKIKALKALVKKVNRPILLATKFIHEQDRILKEIPGAEKFSQKRLDAWDRREIPMWVTDPRSVSHGLNLQKGGDTVVWFTPTYSREDYDQLNDRVIREGQTNPTSVYRLIMNDSIDGAVTESLRHNGNQQAGLMSALSNLKRLRDAA